LRSSLTKLASSLTGRRQRNHRTTSRKGGGSLSQAASLLVRSRMFNSRGLILLRGQRKLKNRALRLGGGGPQSSPMRFKDGSADR
jgi:hypothetical protein